MQIMKSIALLIYVPTARAISMLLVIFVFVQLSCKKFVSVDPPTNELTPPQVFGSDEAAVSAIKGIYARMRNNGFFAGSDRSLTFLAGLSADELINHQATVDYLEFYENQLSPTNSLLGAYF